MSEKSYRSTISTMSKPALKKELKVLRSLSHEFKAEVRKKTAMIMDVLYGKR